MLITAQRIQNKLARWITGMSRKTRTSTLLETLNWFSIKELEKIHSITQLWKILHKNKPEIIRQKIEMNDNFEIQLQPIRLQFTNNSFLNRTSNEWNKMPPSLRMMKSLPTFKKHLKKWIKERRTLNPD